MKLAPEFTTYTTQLLGEKEFENLLKSLQEEVPVSIRLNKDKLTNYSINAKLTPKAEKVMWASEGYYLPERLTFTFDPLFHAGVYYVQEASSMFLEQALRQYIKSPVVALDLCAAPGGKSTHVISLLPEGSLLVANEVIRNRSFILAENLTKWGNPNSVVTNNDPKDFAILPELFDLIIADVPCSGEGMFRKDNEAISEWSPENVHICQQRQRRIIADIWESLAPGGLLVYSTCTYNTKENEENVEWIINELGATPLTINIPEEYNVTGNLLKKDFPVYRFLPHKTRGEGFFLALLRKSEETVNPHHYKERKKQSGKKEKNKKTITVPIEVKKWIKEEENFFFDIINDQIIAIPGQYEETLRKMKGLRILKSGIRLGEIKGKDIIPDHSLAMNNFLDTSKFPIVKLTHEEAISYLKKETITFSAEVPRGYILLTYSGIPIGFAKNIGNRANNLYPNEWRIRTSYLPEEIKELFSGADK